MNRVMLVGRLTRDPELRSLPSGKPVATFTVATNDYRSAGNERTEYHACVAWVYCIVAANTLWSGSANRTRAHDRLRIHPQVAGARH
jgi:single stranded DNA-binding protein